MGTLLPTFSVSVTWSKVPNHRLQLTEDARRVYKVDIANTIAVCYLTVNNNAATNISIDRMLRCLVNILPCITRAGSQQLLAKMLV